MPREFAPGIPTGRVIKPIPRVRSKSDNQEWDVSLSMHPALRRGDHYDLRLVDPKGRGHSWALPRLPEPGQSTYAAQQATHSKSYSLRKKPWEIPPGYGQTQIGRKVEPVFVQKAEVVEAGPEKVRFLRHHGQETDEFTLRKVYREGMTPLWALNNATKNRNTLEGQKLPSSKPKYKEVRPEQVDFSDVGEVMTPKFDGAHVLVDMKGPKAPMRVYSYRPTERRTGVIEHTYKFPDFQKRRTTDNLRNTMIRAELWASKDGKAIPAEQLGGILNAGVLNSRRKQQEMGVDLRLTGIDVVKHKGKNYQNKTFEDKLKALRDVTRGTKGLVELPPVARTESEKRQLMTDIESGKFPETREGTVLHRTDSAAPPTKVKFKPQDDVYVREVFSKSRGKARGHAGGFAYSVTPDGPVVGRVGTGFDHKTRKDMLDNPEKYVGRVAKVKSQGPFPSGALRAPSFDEWHIDKTPPELMKEAEEGDRRTALGVGAIGLGAGLVASPSVRGSALGFKRVHHGTTPEAAKSIIREGLLKARGGTGESKDFPGLVGKAYRLTSRGKVHVGAPSTARYYVAQREGLREGLAPRSKEMSRKLLKAQFNPLTKGVVSADIPMSQWERFKKDPMHTGKDIAAVGKEDIAAKHVRGGGLRRAVGRTVEFVRGLPSYAAKHPKRFAGGVAGLGAGVGLLGLGTRELMKEGASRWREALRAGEIGVGEIKKLRRAKLLDYDKEVAGLERGTSNIARKLGVKIRSPRPKLQERIEFDDSFMPIRAYKERVAAPTTYQHDKRLVTAPKSKFSLTDAPQGSEDALRAHSRALDAVSRRHEIDEARAAFHSQRRGVKPRPFASHEAPSVITSERRNLALLHPKVRQLFPHSRNVEEAHFRGVLGRPFSGSRADVRSINKDWRSPKTSSELMKEGEERLVDSLKEYKGKVVDKDRVLDAGYMAAKSTRRFGAARAGLRLARDYLEREHPNVLRRLGIHRGD